jgi:hypothetical protein
VKIVASAPARRRYHRLLSGNPATDPNRTITA